MKRAGGVCEDDALIARVNMALHDMWDRLDALPRENPFWVGTNLRTTWYKVHDFAQRYAQRDPADDTARWALVGVSMRQGMFHGLVLLDDPHDVIAVAERVWLQVGVPPGQELADALLRIDPAVRRRCSPAVAFLVGQPFAEAIGRARWELFQDTLVGNGRLDAARACLAEDPAAADELREAARWWAAHRDTDVADRLRELLG